MSYWKPLDKLDTLIEKISRSCGPPSAPRGPILPISTGAPMQELMIEQLGFCMAIGCVLSVSVAAALYQPLRPRWRSILGRLLLAAGPVYLCLDYTADQTAPMIGATATAFAVGFYCLRGWWVPEPAFFANLVASLSRPIVGARRAASRVALQQRVRSIIRADRRLMQSARQEPMRKAA